MPKLLQFNVSANCGSTGRLAEDLGDVAISHGWESYIAYGRSKKDSSSQLIKIGSRFDIYTHVIKTRLFDRHGFGSRRATRTLIKQIDEIKPDIIQFHNVHGYYLNLPILLEYIAKHDIPIIWSLHDCWSMTGHCAHFALVGCDKWKTGCFKCPLKHNYPESWCVDSSKRNYKDKKRMIEAIPRLTIVSGSQWLADIAQQSYFRGRDIKVIANGIDTEIYAPRDNANELRKKYGLEGKFVIMASGTVWLDYKGINDYGKLRRELSEDYAIILVGLSDEDFDKVPDGVIGIPRTKSPNELAEFYSMADCVMSLSRLESFGLTPVEGFACGTPAIVYDNVALSELISDEVGFKVQVGDIDALKKAVISLKQKGKQSYSENCRKLALNTYDKAKCFGNYIDLYNKILGK